MAAGIIDKAAQAAELATLRQQIAERDQAIAWMAERIADPAPAPAAKVAAPVGAARVSAPQVLSKAEMQVAIQGAVAAAVAKAAAETEAHAEATAAVLARMEAQHGPVAKTDDPVAEALHFAREGVERSPSYWRAAIGALGERLAPGQSPSAKIAAVAGTPQGRALLSALTGDPTLAGR